ncbi:MAG: hypothetical protein VST68_00495 [Nitrospirota bacterium]|nr:hypothetical protein [Nitrospirota bacterium]
MTIQTRSWPPGARTNHDIGRWFLTLLLICGLFTGCSHWRESYLNGSVEAATQEQIETKLGKPWRLKTSLLNGEATWIYRYTLTSGELDPMGVNTVGRGVSAVANSAASIIGRGNSNLAVDKPRCFHYLLTFHESTVLKSWVREPCADTAL